MNERAYEVLVEKAWCKVTPLIFHWWTGKRRLDGVDYEGPVYSLQTRWRRQELSRERTATDTRGQLDLERVTRARQLLLATDTKQRARDVKRRSRPVLEEQRRRLESASARRLTNESPASR